MFRVSSAAVLMLLVASEVSAALRYNAALLRPAKSFNDSGDVFVTSVNNLGQAAGRERIQAPAPSIFHTIRWDAAGNPTDLNRVGSQDVGNGGGYGINDRGRVIGPFNQSIGLYDPAFGTTPHRSYSLPPGSLGLEGIAYAAGLNVAGQGFITDPRGGPTYYLTNAADDGVPQVTVLNRTTATAINDLGQLAGTRFNGERSVSFIGNPSTGFTDIEPAFVVLDLSSNGTLVGAMSDAAENLQPVAFHSTTGIRQLPLPPGTNRGRATAINESGLIVGWAEDSAVPNTSARAVLWDVTGVHEIQSLLQGGAGWTLVTAADISDTGYIVGGGRFQGNLASFILTPIPEPASIMAFAAAALSLIRRPRR